MRPRARTTLTDVAKRAKVSPATASMVLSGKGPEVRIASATAERVRSAARELDYSPNLLVRSIQLGKSGVLAFFSAFRNLEDDDRYMDRLSRGLEQAAGGQGYDLLIHCAYERTTEESYQSINGGRADGLLLFAPHPDDPMLALMRRSRLPCVLLNTRDPLGALSSVKDDFQNGMRLVAEALVANGHREIACVHLGPHSTPDAAERIAALDASLGALGVARRDEWILDGLGRRDLGIDDLLRGDRPTAIVCTTDHLAYTVIDALDARGICVPDEISVVGYDGIRWPSETRHRAASVVVDLKAQAVAAVQLLLTPETETREVTIPVLFDPGTTLGPARRSAQRSHP